MAIDKNKIINKALVKLGARPITSISDGTDEAETMENLYEMALRSILSECLWTFATKRLLLTQLSETIPWNNEKETLSYIYQRPPDAIRCFETNDSDAYWREEGDTIVSDTSGLGVKYTFYMTDSSKYRPSFADALSDRLAYEAAYPILNSRSKTEDILQIYEGISLPKAMSDNAQTGTPMEMNDDYWLDARHGGANVHG